MESLKHASHTRPLLTQTKNNTTLWIGHLKADPTDHFAGQTFQCTTDGLLNNIQIYADAVQTPGDVTLILHSFDPKLKKWGEVLGSSKIHIERNDDSRWIRFDMPAVSLKSEYSYGFRLETADAMVALGEAASHAKNPFTFGQEWKADSKDRSGHFFSYFSLAFKVELCA